MEKTFHKIASLLLAVLVLGSTISFTIDKHFCGEHLIDIAFFGEAQPCAMEKALIAKYGDELKKSDCCKDEQLVIEGQDTFKNQFDTLTLENVVFIAAFTNSYINLFQGLEQYFVPYDGYPPPLITSDYQILYDQYLI